MAIQYLIYNFLTLSFICCGIRGKIIWDRAWIDNNKPYKNGTEIEPPPNATYLSTVCPSSSGGTLALRCQANKGAPFHVFQNNSVLHFVATCDPRLGILCNPYVGYNATCPDMSMNFGCDVPDPTTTTTTTTTSGPRTALKLNSGSAGSTLHLHRSLRGGGFDPSTSSATKSSTTPLPASTNKPTSTPRPTTAAPTTSSNTPMTQSTTSLTMSSNKQSNAGYVTSGSNGVTSASVSLSPNGHVGSGGQCQCPNSRNGAGSVVYNGWMIIVLVLSFV